MVDVFEKFYLKVIFTGENKIGKHGFWVFSVFHEKINTFLLNEISKSTKMIVLNPRELSCSFKPLKGKQSKTMQTKKGNEIRRQVVQLRHLNWLIQTCFTCSNEYVAVRGTSLVIHCTVGLVTFVIALGTAWISRTLLTTLEKGVLSYSSK